MLHVVVKKTLKTKKINLLYIVINSGPQCGKRVNIQSGGYISYIHAI